MRAIVLPLFTFALSCAGSTPEPAAQHAEHQAGHHGEHHGERPAHQHSFADAEQWAKRFDDPKRVEWQKPEEVISAMSLEPGMRVADIGAGTGYFLPHLSGAVGAEGHVYGVDIEPSLVDYMNKRIEKEALENASTVLAAPDDPKLSDGTINRVLIVNTWHHISQRQEYGKKLQAALTADGQVYVVDYTKDSPRGPPVEHRLPPEEVAQELEGAGFSTEILSESLPYQYIVVGRKGGS